MNTIAQNGPGYNGLVVDKTHASQRLLQPAQRQPHAAVEVVPAAKEVSLSSDAKDPDGNASKVTEKFEQTAAELFELAPLSLPTKADLQLFEKNFTRELNKAGVDTSIEIKLRSNGEGKVEVINDHPDKDKIEALFANDSSLQQGYVRADTYQTMQKLHALHQQWQQKINEGASEEAANLWLVQAAQSMVAQNSGIRYQDGKIAQPSSHTSTNDPMQVIANLKASIS
jgi:hypothetical protein